MTIVYSMVSHSFQHKRRVCLPNWPGNDCERI